MRWKGFVLVPLFLCIGGIGVEAQQLRVRRRGSKMVGFTWELTAPPSAKGALAENVLARPEERGLAKGPDLEHAADPMRNMMMRRTGEAKFNTDLLVICLI
jgi:hypothetical protein